jgi:hypothetical protein
MPGKSQNDDSRGSKRHKRDRGADLRREIRQKVETVHQAVRDGMPMRKAFSEAFVKTFEAHDRGRFDSQSREEHK